MHGNVLGTTYELEYCLGMQTGFFLLFLKTFCEKDIWSHQELTDRD